MYVGLEIVERRDPRCCDVCVLAAGCRAHKEYLVAAVILLSEVVLRRESAPGLAVSVSIGKLVIDALG